MLHIALTNLWTMLKAFMPCSRSLYGENFLFSGLKFENFRSIRIKVGCRILTLRTETDILTFRGGFLFQLEYSNMVHFGFQTLLITKNEFVTAVTDILTSKTSDYGFVEFIKYNKTAKMLSKSYQQYDVLCFSRITDHRVV